MTLEDAYKQVVPFGKFKGKTLQHVANADITYLAWMRDKVEDLRLLEAVVLICEANVREIAEAEDRRERHAVIDGYRKRGW